MKFLDLIKEDLAQYKNDWMRPGFQALLVHRFGARVLEIQNPRIRKPLKKLSSMMYILVRNFYGIELPPTAHIGRRLRIEHQHGIIVHYNAEIGDDCVLRHEVTIGQRDMFDDRAPRLGNRVEVGAGAKIIGDLFIGDDAVIGANAVVVKNVPHNSHAIGIPAKVVETRNRTDFPTPQPTITYHD
jgi:serine O-acetyltransferase